MISVTSEAPLETVFVIIKGAVQGVWYRYAAVRHAHSLGVTGWVKNLQNGTVEAMIQGAPDHVDLMLGWLRVGPPRANVTECNIEERSSEKRNEGFQQL